jgi:hypothetical protein
LFDMLMISCIWCPSWITIVGDGVGVQIFLPIWKGSAKQLKRILTAFLRFLTTYDIWHWNPQFCQIFF